METKKNDIKSMLEDKLNLLREARKELSIIEESNTIARKNRDKELKQFVEQHIYQIRDKVAKLESDCYNSLTL